MSKMTTAKITKGSTLQEVADILMKIIKSATDLCIMKFFYFQIFLHLFWASIYHKKLNRKLIAIKRNHSLP